MDTSYSTYDTMPMDKRVSTLSIPVKSHDKAEFAINRFSQKYDSYRDFMYKSGAQPRERLSSTGDGSGESTTASGSSGSSYGEREDLMSETRTESEENDNKEEDERKPPEGKITEAERLQVESFFKGLKTQVFVSPALANLYIKTPSDADWQLRYTGIPVIILDVGESRARTKRRIQIALAERGTSFMLWRDTIDNLSAYKTTGPAFHTMCFSEDHTVQVGLSFDTVEAAREIWETMDRLVQCPENISLSTPGKKKKMKKEKKQPKPEPLPSKSHISQPCCFQHITNVDRNDINRYFSLQELLPKAMAATRILQLHE